MKCDSCGHDSRPCYIIGRRIKCLPCAGRVSRAPSPVRFEWRDGPALNRGCDLFCYAITESHYYPRQARYVGMVSYARGNWLERLLWPRRWLARAGFNVGRFRYQYEAQLYVEHHATGGDS